MNFVYPWRPLWFSFTAERRVDLRELVKDLASVDKVDVFYNTVCLKYANDEYQIISLEEIKNLMQLSQEKKTDE